MDKIYFNAYLTESIFFKPEQLYDKNRKVLKDLTHIEKGNVYFVVERGRVRVDPNNLVLSSIGFLSVNLIKFDGSISTEIIEVAPLFIDRDPMFKKTYGDSATLQKYIKLVKDVDDYKTLLHKSKGLPLIGVSLISKQQTKKNIALRLYTPDGQVTESIFMIHSILSSFNIDTKDYPNIVYIGKSESLSDRIYKHEKIQEALSVLDDDSDIYLYAFQFDSDKLIHKRLHDKQTYIERNYTHDVSKTNALSIVEMTLINYFKPTLNSDYVNADIPSNSIFRNSLLHKYTHMAMEVIHDEGSYWQFGSSVINPSLTHSIRHNV